MLLTQCPLSVPVPVPGCCYWVLILDPGSQILGSVQLNVVSSLICQGELAYSSVLSASLAPSPHIPLASNCLYLRLHKPPRFRLLLPTASSELTGINYHKVMSEGFS